MDPDFSLLKLCLVMSVACHIVNAQIKTLMICAFFHMYVTLHTIMLAHTCGSVWASCGSAFASALCCVGSRRSSGRGGVCSSGTERAGRCGQRGGAGSQSLRREGRWKLTGRPGGGTGGRCSCSRGLNSERLIPAWLAHHPAPHTLPTLGTQQGSAKAWPGGAQPCRPAAGPHPYPETFWGFLALSVLLLLVSPKQGTAW